MRTLFIIAAVVVLALPGCTPKPTETWQNRLKDLIETELETKGIPAVSIAVVDRRNIVYEGGFGFADAEAQTQVTSETVYRVASVSKLFTAMTVMQLVERGALDLDAAITKYLPDFRPENPFDVPITLRQLLSHRSGLVREPPIGHYFDPEEPTLESTIRSLNETTLIYKPTTRTKYSNAAVSVAGYVVERTENRPFGDHAFEALIDPLGLEHTSFHPRADLRDNLGIGYMWRYDSDALTEAPIFELGIGPAANMYTTTRDLARFAIGLFEIAAGEHLDVMQPATLEDMWTIQFDAPETKSGFGLGFYVTDFRGERRIQHAGIMYGYATRLYVLPESEVAVAIVGNLDATNSVVDRIGNYALSLVLALRAGDPLPGFRTTQPVDATLARRLAGQYAHDTDEIVLVERDGLLYLERKGVRHTVRAHGDSLVTDGRLGDGFWLLEHGDTLFTVDGTFTRQPAPVAQPIPESWRGLIGEYGWDHNTLYVLEQNGRLEILIEWFYRYVVTGIAPDVFLFPDDGLYMNERLTFTRATDGNATEVSMAGVVFKRRAVGPESGNTFMITPVKPIDELRSAAAAASPPPSGDAMRAPDLVDVTTLDPTLRLDVRYASTNNFMGTALYRSPRVFLQRPAAEAVVEAHRALNAHGLGLILYDGYRPWSVTKMFWDGTPDSLRLFVANPSNGSRHNRGCAIDVGLYDLKTGNVLEMPSGYDEFTARAFPDYPGGTSLTRGRRELLRLTMEDAGFSVYKAEWWHYDYRDWRDYPILDIAFEDL